MKEQIKVTEKWVYIKCSKCGIKKDFSRESFDKKFKESGLSDDAAGLKAFADSFVCYSCLKDKQKPVTVEPKTKEESDNTSVISKSEQRRIAIQKEVIPFTKEKQLGKKEKNNVSKEQKEKEMEDLLAK